MSPTLAEVQRASRIMAEAVRDKSYQLLPLGEEAARYLRSKRKRFTDASYEEYEGALDKFARHFAHLDSLADFEPPVGTERIEEFLDSQWGAAAPGTYNKNLSILRSFFEFYVKRGELHGDPTLLVERAKKGQTYRTTFSDDQRRAIIASAEELRDRISLRLLLDYGIRKGALQRIQFKHFDHFRKRLTIFTKGRKVRELPIPHTAFWFDLERHIQDVEAKPGHYLMYRQRRTPTGGRRVFPEEPMGAHALHNWWYRKLADAGVVPKGTSSGERMHKARHSAGQRILDTTGDLKLVQQILMHASIRTTGDIYVNYDNEQLAAKLAEVFKEDE